MSDAALTEAGWAEQEKQLVQPDTAPRKAWLDRIANERSGQIYNPGSEFDVSNTPNEWVAIAAHYLNSEVRRGGYKPSREEFEHALVKAAAVILAALEFAPTMQAMGHLKGEPPEDTKSIADAIERLAQLKQSK